MTFLRRGNVVSLDEARRRLAQEHKAQKDLGYTERRSVSHAVPRDVALAPVLLSPMHEAEFQRGEWSPDGSAA